MLESIGVSENIPSAFFSMEMGKLQIAQRILCARAHVSMSKLRHGKLSGSEIAQLQLACGTMQGCPVFIDDTPGMSVMEVRAKACRLRLLHGIRVVFVDYLQLMSDRMAARENRQQEISSISRGLKALARELNIPVVAMAQLNRQVEARSSNRPRMSDLRESGAIEQDADVIILLHREDYYWDKKKRREQSEQFQQIQGRTELIVDKQRNGPTGIVELHFNELYARFDNAASRFVHEEEGYSPDSFGAAEDFGAPGPRELLAQPPEDEEAAPF